MNQELLTILYRQFEEALERSDKVNMHLVQLEILRVFGEANANGEVIH